MKRVGGDVGASKVVGRPSGVRARGQLASLAKGLASLGLVSLALWGCGPKVKPGLGLEVWVEGNTEGQRASLISVTFDRAMVAGNELGKDLKLSSSSPFRIEPKVPGTLRWREDRKLSFEPDAPLPRSTEFVVTIPKGTHAPDHVGLVENYEFKFETERLSLITNLLQGNGLPSAKRWAVPDQPVSLEFNQPVLPPDVLTACGYHSALMGVRIGTRFSQGDPNDQAGRERFALQPSERLEPDTNWEFRCDASLHGAEGPLSLKPDPNPSAGDGEGPEGKLTFRTFGPFKAEAVLPSGADVDPDTASVSLRFSTPPAQPSGPVPMTITPAPEEVNPNIYVSDDTLVARVRGLAPHTEYKVEIAGGLKDVFGQSLYAPFSAAFRTGGIRPGYDLETGSWSVESSRGGYVAWARNVDRVEVRGAALTEEQLFDVLPEMTWWDREMVDLKKLKIPVVERTLKPEGPQNRWNQLLLDPKALFGQSTGRFFYIASRAPGVMSPYETDDAGKPLAQGYQEVLLNLTDLGLTTKFSGNSGLAWVTRLSDGRPQPGAEVIVRKRSGPVLWRGTTDDQGLVSMPGRARLLGDKSETQTPNAEEEEGSGEQQRLLVFARLGNDVTFADPERSGSFAPWSFGVSSAYTPHELSLRGFLHTDRGLYRPGDTVHSRGLARLLELGKGLTVPTQTSAAVTIYDPRGEQILRQDVALSRFGGFNLDYTLSEASALGDYRIQAALPQGNFSETFTVEEFRANTFEVKMSSPVTAAFAGDELSLSALGNYFYGAPVRSAQISFRVHSRSRWVDFKDYPEFEFGTGYGSYYDDYDDYSPYGQEAFITEQTLKLDSKGQADIKVALPKEQFTSPSTLLVSATVQDETNQTVSANLTLPLHRARLYLGIDSGGWTAPMGKPQKTRLVALNPDGKPIASNVKFSVKKHSWSCAWERWGYTGSYRCEEKVEPTVEANLSLSTGPLDHEVTYPSAGEYTLMLEGKDAKGNEVKTSRRVWVWGDGDGGWRADDSGQFKIIADKANYRVGDTAHLVLQSSTKGATVLVTVERDGVLDQRVLGELPQGQTIDVPITSAFAPNAYVSVVLARGRTGDGSRGLPKTTMGVVNLPVNTDDKRLHVQVETDQAEYRPGQPVTATLHVKDSAGRPVEAEVALAAADEGVLSLIDFKTPDPLTTFFRAWGLGVTTASQYERLAQVPAPGQERYVTGGDSAGAPGTFRSRFRATAYWNPAVMTNAEGVAKVTFDSPDNLTAFRLMAVAADTQDHFGSSDKRFVVNKPVQLLSALPRFTAVGDLFDAAVMVTNDTQAAATGRVQFWTEGGVTSDAGPGPQSKEISVPSGGRLRVAFPVRASATGSAKLRFGLELGAERDGLEQVIPVRYPTSEETLVVSEGSTDSRVQIPVIPPEGTLAGSATLDVSVDPDGLAGLEDSLRDLIQYPYGCLEQTTSRLIPLVAVQELTKASALEELQGERVRNYIEIAIAKIYRHQTASGGFGLWPGSEEEPYLTAYALWGLSLAKEAGYKVNENVVKRGVDYLRYSLTSENMSSHGHTEMGELGSRAFALYVLTVLKQPEAGHTTALAERADKLPTYGQAFLARALASVVGEAHASVGNLLSRWAPVGSASSALIQEADAPQVHWYWSSNVRSTAVVLDTLVALRPGDARIPRLVKGLLDERRGQGSWDTTQEQLYALVALTHYAKARAGASVSIEVGRGPDITLKDTLQGEGLSRMRHLRLPVELGDTRPLSIAASTGTAHYRVLLRYRRDLAHQPASARGMSLARTFLDPENGSVLLSAKEGQMVRVRLELGTGQERSRVALSDYLPAGLEPINTRFTTAPSYATENDGDWYKRLWVTHRELGEERVDAFMDWVTSGSRSFEYLARATTVGKFVVPAATAAQMYDPDVQARTASSIFEVIPR